MDALIAPSAITRIETKKDYSVLKNTNFMNMFALTKLQELIAANITKYSGKEVRLGRYCHQADSFHIYGSYFKEFEERFLKSFERRPLFADRTMNYIDVAKPFMDEAIPAILAKAKAMR